MEDEVQLDRPFIVRVEEEEEEEEKDPNGSTSIATLTENPADKITTDTDTNNNSSITRRIVRWIRKSVINVMKIVGVVLFFCLLITGTVAMALICRVINIIIHIINSTKGDGGGRKVVSPISNGASTSILLLVMILLGALLNVPEWQHNTLCGLQIVKWIQVFIIILGYLCIGTSTEFMISSCKESNDVVFVEDPWFWWLLEVTNFTLLLPVGALIMKVSPTWRHGRKWIYAVILVILAQNVISLAGHLMVRYFKKALCSRAAGKRCNGANCGFYLMQGLRRSITFIVVALLHLLIWIFHLCPTLTLAGKVADFGTWIFLCELLFGALWIIKDFILILWKAHALYDKRLMRKLSQWYCLDSLGLISLRNRTRTLHADQPPASSDNNVSSALDFVFEFFPFTLTIFVNPLEVHKNRKWNRTIKEWREAKGKLVQLVLQAQGADGPVLSIHDKETVAQAFLPPGCTCLPNDNDISEFCQKWRYIYGFHEDDTDSTMSKTSKEVLEDHSIRNETELEETISPLCKIEDDSVDKILYKQFAKILYKQLEETNQTKRGVDAKDFRPWMERAYQNCLQLHGFLAGGRDVVNFLNWLMLGFIITLVVIIWLHLNQILTTKVTVSLTSPILALTFIFGDTLKTMFQGFLFAYITHPFAIGDVCVINRTQLKVKDIGIWRTTFSKLGTEDHEVVYPNAALTNSAIISYEGGTINLNDSVEFTLHPAMDIQSLEGSIRRYFLTGSVEEDTQQGAFSESGSENNTHDDVEVDVVVQQIPDNIKMTVHFKHDNIILDMTSKQASISKIKRKSEILENLLELVLKLEQKPAIVRHPHY